MKRMFLLGAVVAATSWMASASSVYDDCVWFFNGGTDGFGGTVVDGAVQKGEIADELHRGTSSHANHQSQPQGCDLAFVREKVPFHASGVGTQVVSCVKLQNVVYPGDGETNYNFSTLQLPFLGDLCPGANYSAIIRFRRDQTNPLVNDNWLVSFGYGGDKGWLLGFVNGGTLSVHSWVTALAHGGFNSGSVPSRAIPVGTWTDIGVVVRGNQIWFYEAFPGANNGSNWSDLTPAYTSTLMVWADEAKTKPKDLSMGASTIHLGAQNVCTELHKYVKNENMAKFAPVTIQRVAFWNRALDPGEIAEAFAYPRPGIFTLGAANGSSDEFAADAAATKTINASRLEEPMQDVPKQLRTGDCWTLNFDLQADDALNQLFVFTATPDSPAATLAVEVNGRPVASGESLPAGGKCVVPIRAKYFLKGNAGTTKANVLTVRRTDSGSTPVNVDAVWLGGSWTVGIRDGNPSKSFAWNGSAGDQFCNQFDGFQFQRARNLTGLNTNMWFRIRAPKDVTDLYGSMTFIGRHYEAVNTKAKIKDPVDFRVLENSTVLTSGTVPRSMTDFSCVLGAGEHRLWYNLIAPETVKQDPANEGGCMWFDCYTLTFDIPPLGLMMLLR